MSGVEQKPTAAEADRRKFLKSCGRFAGSASPAMIAMLSTSMHSDAIAKSDHGKGGLGYGKALGKGKGKHPRP